MFGASSGRGKPGVGQIAAVAGSAALVFAMFLATSVKILSPLDQALHAMARDRLPTFEEEILVQPPGTQPPRTSGRTTLTLVA